jgi:adenylate cyclase
MQPLAPGTTREHAATVVVEHPIPDSLIGPEPDEELSTRLILGAEIRAEQAIAWLRLAVAILIVCLVLAEGLILDPGSPGPTHRPFVPSVVTVLGFSAISSLALVLLRAGRYRPVQGWLFAFLDVAVLVAALAEGAARNGLSGNELFLLATAWGGPVVLAFNALRYRAAIVAGAAAAYVAGGLVVALWAGMSIQGPPPRSEFAHLADLSPNVIRLALVTLSAVCLTLVVYRGKRLLVRALVEQRGRALLTRFLPAEVASEITRPGSRLRTGLAVECLVLFVDLRDSTRITQHMAPLQVADFMTRFRRRIAREVSAHGGLIEKFAGDGALVVFGVPEPRHDDGVRALACAKRLIEMIGEWNDHREADSSLSIAIGLHSGPCFCGLVGDEARLEFTVIGDAVNVAARLEALAKQLDELLLVSRRALQSAGEQPGSEWRLVGAEQLRGRDETIEVYALAGR